MKLSFYYELIMLVIALILLMLFASDNEANILYLFPAGVIVFIRFLGDIVYFIVRNEKYDTQIKKKKRKTKLDNAK